MIFTYEPVSKRRFTRLEDIPEGVPLRVIDWRNSTGEILKEFWDQPVEYTRSYMALEFQRAGKYAFLPGDTFILELW